MTTRQIVQFFIKYKYQAIFPIAFLEGPIITVISGVLVSRGRLELVPALLTVFLGDLLSDFVFYLIGRGGRRVIEYFKFIHISEMQLLRLEMNFKEHPWKTMIISKVAYGLGMVFMVASGASRMAYQQFIEYVASLNLIRSAVLLALGYYFGKAAIKFGSQYFVYYVVGVIILLPTLFFIFRKKYFSNEI